MVWMMRCLSLLAAMGLVSAKGLKAGTILWFDLPMCPCGWEMVNSTQGRLVVGADTSRTIGATVGDALTKDEIERGDIGMHSHELKQGAISVTFEEAGVFGILTFPIEGGGTFGVSGTKNSPSEYTAETINAGFSFAEFQLCALKEDSPSMEIPARSIHFREDDECGEGWEEASELGGRTLAATSGSESQLSPNILGDQEVVGHSHDFTYEGWEWDGGGVGGSTRTNSGPAAKFQDQFSGGTITSEPSTMNIPYTQLLVCEKSNSAELAQRPTAPPEGALSFRGVGEVTCGDGWKRAPSKYSEKLFIHGFQRWGDPYEPGGSRIIGAEESTLTPVHVHSGSELEIDVGEGGTVGYSNAVFVFNGIALKQLARAEDYSVPLQQTAEWPPAGTVAFPYAALVMCTPCAAGFMCDDDGERACDAGYFCPPGSSTRTKEFYHCGAGSWSDKIGAKNEDECSNLPCDPGHWCPKGSTSSTGEGLCPAGYSCAPFEERELCQPGRHCPEGTNVAEGIGPCPEGSYCTPGQASKPCKAGYRCPEGSFNEEGSGPCPAGNYCPGGGMAMFPCPAGYICPEGSSEGDAIICPAGRYCEEGSSVVDETRLFACLAGYACPPGSKTQVGIGLCDERVWCPPGSESTQGAGLCPAGFSCERGADRRECKDGEYCPEGSIHAYVEGENLCPSGKWCAAGQAPQVCDAGYFCPEGSRSSQGAGVCRAGFYCPNGESEKLCNRGYKCEEGSTTSTGTGVCPAGEFCEPGKPSRLCNAGRWCGEGAIEELETDAGYWSAQGANSSTGSGVCEAGFFCRSGTTQDEKYLNPCPEGKYCKEGTTDGSEAPPCRAGHYCPSGTSEDAMLNLYQCPRLFYCPEGTGATPVPCPDNYECGLTNGLSDGCKPFYYVAEDMKCVECPEGLKCEGGFARPTRDDDSFRVETVATGYKVYSYTLCILDILAALCFLTWMLLNRRSRIVRTSQPGFLALIACGAIVSSLTIMAMTIDDGGNNSDDETGMERSYDMPSNPNNELADTACMAAAWLYSLGFVLTFAPLFAKLYRVQKIMEATKKLRRIKVPASTVASIIVVLLAIDTAVLAAWTMYEPLRFVRTGNREITEESTGKCEGGGSSSKFVGTIASFHLIVLVVGNILVYKARNIETKYSEGRYISISMVSNLQVMAIGIPIMILVADDPALSLFIRSSIIFLNDFCVQCFIFVPKILLSRNRESDAGKQTSRESNMSDLTIATNLTSRRTTAGSNASKSSSFDQPRKTANSQNLGYVTRAGSFFGSFTQSLRTSTISRSSSGGTELEVVTNAERWHDNPL